MDLSSIKLYAETEVVPTRLEIFKKLEEFGLDFDMHRAMIDVEYANVVLTMVNQNLSKMKVPKKNLSYVITLTTQVVAGIPRKQYPEFVLTLNRIRSMPNVVSIKGAWELTKQGALHCHFIVNCIGYLDRTKVQQFHKEFLKIEKIRDAKHLSSCETYIYKDQDSKEILEYLKNYNICSSIFNL